MKKNIKKLLVSSISTIVATISVTPIVIATTNVVKGQNHKNPNLVANNFASSQKSINFGGQKFQSIEEAANDYLSKDGNVTQKMYLGDLDAATSANEYNVVNLKKLQESTSANVTKAYKTLTDEYTDDINVAKDSLLQKPVIKWSDRKGNMYDSESEAKMAIALNSESYSSPVAYYEVKDYSRLVNNKPTIVKINPLNADDLNTLKNIAIKNSFINNSEFSITRKTTSNDQYVDNDFQGKSDQEVEAIVKSIKSDIASIVRDGLWLNNKVVAIPDNQQIRGWVRTGVTNVKEANFPVNYSTSNAAFNDIIGIDYKTYISDMEYMTNQTKFLEKFDLYDNWKGVRSPYKNAKLKSNQTLFGGQVFSFELLNFQVNKMWILGVSDAWQGEEVSFLGRGKQSNVYFSFNPNQDKFSELLNNQSFFDYRKNIAFEKLELVRQYIHNNLKDYLTTAEAEQFFNDIKFPIMNSMLSSIIKKDSIWINYVRHSSSFKSSFDEKLEATILNFVDNYVVPSQNLTTKVTSFVRRKQQHIENKNNDDAMYTIDYNGIPLFKINKNGILDSAYNDRAIVYSPLSTVKKHLNDKLNSDSSFIDTLSNNLTNISNSVEMTNGSFTHITKPAIQNYDKENKKINFAFNKTNASTELGNDVYMFDSSIYASQGVNESDLNKALNRREEDDVANLNNKYGTFEAVYQYNNSLKAITTNNRDLSESLKSRVSQNAIKDPNNVVVLYEKDKTPKSIKYGEYLNYGYKFNESLSDGNVKILNSAEKRTYEVSIEGLNVPTKNYVYYDYQNNIVSSAAIDEVNGNYDAAIKQAHENALNKINVQASKDYVFNIKTDGTKELLKNQTTKLNVLTIKERNQTYEYGFVKYSDLYNYLKDYIALSDNESTIPSVTPPFTKTSVDLAQVSHVLSGYNTLEEVNNLSAEDKFVRFGQAFNISNQATWNRFIGKDGLKFIEISNGTNPSLKSLEADTLGTHKAQMNITLQNNTYFDDGTNTFSQEVNYTPGSVVLPAIARNNTNAFLAGAGGAFAVIVLAEVILLGTIFINQNLKNRDNANKKLMRLSYAYNKR